MQTLTICDAKVVSTRIAVGQFKGQFKGAMEELSGKVQKASSKSKHRVMDEMPQRVQKANTLHQKCISSCNVQPNQLGRPARLYLKDPAPTLGIEHHTSRHLRLDGQGAVDADR